MSRNSCRLAADALQLIVNIIVLAAIYALLACGYVLIYRVSRVMNMAHGELAMLGAYLLYTTASLFADHPVTAIAAALVLSLMVGVLVYVVLMRKMTGEMVLAAMLTTIALGILLRGLIVLIWSAQQQYPAAGARFANPSIELVGGARISTCAALMVLTTVVGLWRPVRIPALRSLGHPHARGRAEPAAGGAARHQPARDLCPRLGALDLHRSIAGMLIALDSGLDQTMVDDRPQGVSGGAGRRASTASLGALVGSLIVAGAEVLRSTTSIRCSPTWCRSSC